MKQVLIEDFLNKQDSYKFRIIVHDAVIDFSKLETKFYNSGCNDALLSVSNNIVSLEFDRESDSLENAIDSALKNIQEAGFKQLEIFHILDQRREDLGKQMVQDLIRIAELTGQPIKHMKFDDNGVFYEVKNPITYNFQECLDNADKGVLVSFFAEEMILLSQKRALLEGLSIESPYVLLKNGLEIPIFNTEDLEMRVRGIWTTYFEKRGNEPYDDFNPRD